MSKENNTQSILIRDLLRNITIDRSDEETMVDYYLSQYLNQESESEMFIENIKSILCDPDCTILNKEVNTDEDFEMFLASDEGQEFIQAVCEAAYCTWRGIVIDDDTRICEDRYTYYIHWNGTGVESQYESDIDLG